MRIDSRIKTTGEIPDNFIEVAEIMDLYRQGTLELNQETSQDFYDQIINPLKSKVVSYCIEFDMVANSYIKNNSVLSKMRNSIMSPTHGERSKIIEGITNKELNSRKKSARQMIQTMQKGHSLLLEMREVLLGSKISTKFIISIEGKTYSIDEKFLSPYLTLSAFGGGTVSNPFSLAYKIDKELLKDKNFLENAEIISNGEVWNKIFSLKPDYLKTYKTPKTGRIYTNYYFDSKDAEIYELFMQNKEKIADLKVSDYAKLRAELGGGGGYASPFYKIGDIGSVQVKYFNIKQGQNNATVNFARFSLLRDRFQELYNILDQDSIQSIGQQLSKFFTEEESHISQEVSRQVNREAKQTFNKIFNL